jgi:hypothetical protein
MRVLRQSVGGRRRRAGQQPVPRQAPRFNTETAPTNMAADAPACTGDPTTVRSDQASTARTHRRSLWTLVRRTGLPRASPAAGLPAQAWSPRANSRRLAAATLGIVRRTHRSSSLSGQNPIIRLGGNPRGVEEATRSRPGLRRSRTVALKRVARGLPEPARGEHRAERQHHESVGSRPDRQLSLISAKRPFHTA